MIIKKMYSTEFYLVVNILREVMTNTVHVCVVFTLTQTWCGTREKADLFKIKQEAKVMISDHDDIVTLENNNI